MSKMWIRFRMDFTKNRLLSYFTEKILRALHTFPKNVDENELQKIVLDFIVSEKQIWFRSKASVVYQDGLPNLTRERISMRLEHLYDISQKWMALPLKIAWEMVIKNQKPI